MAKKKEEADLPDTATSLRQLARLAALWRGAGFDRGLNPVQWEALRYLAVANRHSNTPGALTKYLGATKGTISQTVQSLEKKGLVEKSGRDSDLRAVGLALTEKAQALLAADQRQQAVSVVQGLKPKAQKRFAQALDTLVSAEALRLDAAAFGVCRTCSQFREASVDASAHCMGFELPISESEEQQICVAHQPR